MDHSGRFCTVCCRSVTIVDEGRQDAALRRLVLPQSCQRS